MGLRTYIQTKLYERRKRRAGLVFPLYCKAHGVKPPDRQGAIVQSKAGDGLQLVHVPLAQYPYNTYIYNVEVNRVIGYVHVSLAKKLVYLFGKGFCRDGKITEITGGGDYPYYGCNLEIFESMLLMQNSRSDLVHLRGR